MKSKTLLALALLVPLFQAISLNALEDNALVLLGHSPNGLFPASKRSALLIEPGEEVWIGASNTTLVLLTNPDGDTVFERLVGPETLETFSFSESDQGIWEVSTEGSGLVAEFDVRVARWEPSVKIDYQLDEAGLHVSIDSEGSSLAMMEVEGKPNIFSPGDELDVTDILGAVPFPYLVQIRSPRPIIIDSEAGMVKQTLIFHGILLGKRVEGPLDTSIVLPPLHGIGPGGIIPLRYGEMEIVAISLNTLQELRRGDVFILPKEHLNAVDGKVSNSIVISHKKVLETPRIKVKVIHGTAADSQIFERTIEIPISSLVVEDVEHDQVLRDFSISIDNAATVVSSGIAYTLYGDGAVISSSEEAEPAERTSRQFILTVNGFPGGQLSDNIVDLAPGASTRVSTAANLIDMTLLYERDEALVERRAIEAVVLPFVTLLPGQAVLTISSGEISHDFPAVNSSLYLPPNSYNFTLEVGEKSVSLALDLFKDQSVTLAIDPPPQESIVPALQLLVVLEVILLGTLLLIRKRNVLRKWTRR